MKSGKPFVMTLVAVILAGFALADTARAESAKFYAERGVEAVKRRAKGNRASRHATSGGAIKFRLKSHLISLLKTKGQC